MSLIRHYRYQHLEDAWAGVLEAWLAQPVFPAVIVTPDSAMAAWLKRRCALRGQGLLGVSWLTPGHLRQQLLRELPKAPRTLRREDLHCLVQACARQLSENPQMQALAMDPAPFALAWDELIAAGWDPAEVWEGPWKALSLLLEQHLAVMGSQPTPRLDRLLANSPAPQKPLWKRVLIIGFETGDPALAPLWQATAGATEALVLAFAEPGQSEEDLLGAAALEHLFGEPELLEAPVDDPARYGMEALALAYQNHDPLPEKAPVALHTALDVEAEAALLVDRALTLVNRTDGAAPVALVFSQQQHPLARAVAALLEQASIAHFDALGHLPAQGLPQRRWQQWLQTCLRPHLDEVYALLELFHFQGFWPRKRLEEWLQALDTAFCDAMTTDWRVLWPLAAAELQPGHDEVLLLQPWQTGGAAPVAADRWQAVASRLQWPPRPEALRLSWDCLCAALPEPLPDEAILRWLAEVSRVPGRQRSAVGREPLARLFLVTLEQAARLPWAAVLSGGWQAGAWPPVRRESALLGDGARGQLNGRIREMDTSGQEMLRPGYCLLKSSTRQRRQAERDWLMLMRHCREALTITTSLRDYAEPGRNAAPAPGWLRWEQGLRGKLSSPPQWETEAFIEEPSASTGSLPEPDLGALWQRRRDPTQPFDEFTFCLKSVPPGGLVLSAKAWEQVFRSPALAWLQQVLRLRYLVAAAEDDPRMRATGRWLHAWVRPGHSSDAVPRPALAEWIQRVHGRAQACHALVHEAYARAGRRLPDWWLAEWGRAQNGAINIVEALTEHTPPGGQCITEMALPPETFVALEGLLDIPLTGRFDLLDMPAAGAPTLYDIKTGGDQALSLKALQKDASGLQVVLYGWALVALGLASPDLPLALLKPGEPAAPQLVLAETLDLPDLWQQLARYQSEGCFGWTEFIYQARLPSPFPLATLPVPAHILKTRQELTFPREEHA